MSSALALQPEDEERKWKLTTILNEALFRLPSVEAADRHAKAGGKTYMYLFDKKSTAYDWLGACHACEIAYVFNHLSAEPWTGEMNPQLALDMSTSWANFARTGDPGIEKAPWQPYDPQTRSTMLFGNDGSMTVEDKDGTVLVQKPDGSWTMQGEEGQSAQFGGDWPDNELTRLVPKPDFKLAGSSASDDEFTAAFQSVTVDQIKAYAERVKAKGFTVDAEEADQNVYGVVVYTYTAYDANGCCVAISFASGTGGITIRK